MSNAKKLPVNLQAGVGSAKKFGEDFKKFAMKGNVIDLAVGVIIGGAFGKIVSSLVNDIIMPFIVLITGQTSLKSLSLKLRDANPDIKDSVPLLWTYGNFMQTIIDFLIIAFCIFLFVKFFERFKKKEEEAAPAPAPEPTAQELLLAEIRDELKKQNGSTK